jgi:hypothetical protein
MDTSFSFSPFGASLASLPSASVLGSPSAGESPAGSALTGAFSPPSVRDAQQGDAIATSSQLASFRSLASSSTASAMPSTAAAPTSNSSLASLLGSMPQMPALQLPPVQPQSNANQNQPQQGDLIPFGIDLSGDDD